MVYSKSLHLLLYWFQQPSDLSLQPAKRSDLSFPWASEWEGIASSRVQLKTLPPGNKRCFLFCPCPLFPLQHLANEDLLSCTSKLSWDLIFKMSSPFPLHHQLCVWAPSGYLLCGKRSWEAVLLLSSGLSLWLFCFSLLLSLMGRLCLRPLESTYSFPRAVITKHHKLHDLKQRFILLHHILEARNPKSRCQQGCTLSKGWGRILSSLFLASGGCWQVSAFLGL